MASDDNLKTAVASTLGKDWNYRETLQQGDLTIALWETRSTFWPKQHYALTAAPRPRRCAAHAAQHLHQKQRQRTQRRPSVFGIIISPFAIVLAIALPLFWRKRRRRKSS